MFLRLLAVLCLDDQAGITFLELVMLRVWFGVRSEILSQSAAVGKIQASKDVGKLREPPQRSSAQGAGESNMEGKARV